MNGVRYGITEHGGENGTVRTVNGERIAFRILGPDDENLVRAFAARASHEVDSLPHTHGRRGTLRDAAKFFVEEGGTMSLVLEGDGILLAHIPCVRGGLGNALAYALVQGQCDGPENWSVFAFGRLGQQGDVILRCALTPSERRAWDQVLPQILMESSMGRRGTANELFQGTRRRPGINSTTRYIYEDEEEGTNSLDGRGGRGPPAGARYPTRQGDNRGSHQRDLRRDPRGQQTGVRGENSESSSRRDAQRQASPRREMENGRPQGTAPASIRGNNREEGDDRRGEQRGASVRGDTGNRGSRGTGSASIRGFNVEDEEDPHPGWRDIPDEGGSGGPPAYQSTAADVAGGGGRRGAGGRRR